MKKLITIARPTIRKAIFFGRTRSGKTMYGGRRVKYVPITYITRDKTKKPSNPMNTPITSGNSSEISFRKPTIKL